MTRRQRRFLEILPGFVSWNVILFLVWGGYFIPVVTAYFILAFDVYWVYKSLTVTVAAILSHFKMQAAEHLDWMREVRGFGDWEKVRHVVIVLVANEPPETYSRTLEALSKQMFPLKQVAVVMATEERFPQAALQCEAWRERMGKLFGAYLVTVHPANILGEIKGKSSNEAWGAKEAKRILVDEMKWDMEFMTATSNDSDAILHTQYLACLAFKFLDDPNRYEKFWQPAIVFYNNIWRLPAVTRVVNTLGTLFQIAVLMRKDKLISFSNYSLSFRLLVEVGYWDTDVIPEDYRIFFKAFFAKEGRVEVEPIFLPSSADAAESTSTWKTFLNDYQQKKRWAWGVSDIPTFVEMYTKYRGGWEFNKILRLWRVFEDHLLWPVNWFVITAGITIVSLINPEFTRTTLGYSLPKLSSAILSVTVLFLIILLIIDMRRRPPRPEHMPKWRAWLTPLEFVLMPVVGFFFNALPGLDAHTRLMLGKYLEYKITEKVK